MTPDIDINTERLCLHELVAPSDPLLGFWLDLLQRQLPLNEQVSAGSIVRTVQAKEKGNAANSHLFVALSSDSSDSSQPVGMAQLDFNSSRKAAVLWYLAVSPGLEGQGIGSRIMEDLKPIAWREPTCRYIFLETERPEGHDGAETLEARRDRFQKIDSRNRFYIVRHGAMQLQGVEYYQKAGFSQPVRMDLLVMCNPAFPAPSAEEAYENCRVIFGKSLSHTGALELSTIPPNYRM